MVNLDMVNIYERMKAAHMHITCSLCKGYGVMYLPLGEGDMNPDEEICPDCHDTGVYLEFEEEHDADIFYKTLRILQTVEHDVERHVELIVEYLSLVPHALINIDEENNIITLTIREHGIIVRDNQLVAVF